jgi:hypothetical protein
MVLVLSLRKKRWKVLMTELGWNTMEYIAQGWIHLGKQSPGYGDDVWGWKTEWVSRWDWVVFVPNSVNFREWGHARSISVPKANSTFKVITAGHQRFFNKT